MFCCLFLEITANHQQNWLLCFVWSTHQLLNTIRAGFTMILLYLVTGYNLKPAPINSLQAYIYLDPLIYNK
ncbi:hypothetical protein NIES4106_16860 [Fischerella sp. NIES-4106]|jgi:predicted Rdx family selenoprotein|nr:hypothetical protein NIES4106_16860 [Fischerella sp. NIES-4106]